MYNVAFLIPVKTQNLNNSFIYKLLDNFSKNINKNYKYNFYIGFDNNDKCLYETKILEIFNNDYIEIKIIEFDKNIEHGHLTKMWNILFEISYHENNDYFYQLGDDIIFDNYDFLDEYIDGLDSMDNFGITGYITKNGNQNILTQSFVSRKHYEIFGYFFPDTIKNWYCDNWISAVYLIFGLYKPLGAKISNDGGEERYSINYDIKIVKNEINMGISILEKKSFTAHFDGTTIYP